MASHLEATLSQLQKVGCASPKQVLVFSGHSNLAASRCLVRSLRLLKSSVALRTKIDALCTVFEAVGGLWFDSLSDSSYLPFMCTVHADGHGENIKSLNVACLAPGGVYCSSEYEFPLAYLLLDSNIQTLPHINDVLKALSGENRKSVSGNLLGFHNALLLLGATSPEINHLWHSVACALDLGNMQLANIQAHLASVLQADFDFSKMSNEDPLLLNPFNDVSNPDLNSKRNHYCNAVETVTTIIQRAFQSKVAVKKINSTTMVLVTSPTVIKNAEKAGLREFYHRYLSDRLLIQSILHELQVKGQGQLELGESILSSSGIFTFLDEQLANYRPVQNNYLRWIADASVGQSKEMYRSFFHFDDAVSYKASDFSSFQEIMPQIRNDVEMFNKLECKLWMLHKADFFYIHCGDHSKVQPTKTSFKYLNVFCDLKLCNFCPKFLKVRAAVHCLTENAKGQLFTDSNSEVIDKVRKCVNEQQSLMTTMQTIANDRNMSRFDEAFVEVNYIEKMLEVWLAEAIAACIKLRHVGNVAKIVEEFETFQKFEESQFPLQIRTLVSTKILLQHKILVSKKDMMSHIFRFKESIILYMHSLSESLQKEYALIIAMKNFIRNQKCVQSVCRKLSLAEFFKENTSTTKNLRRHVDSIKDEFDQDSHYSDLQLCFSSISDDHEFTSMFKLVKMLKLYAQEVQFVETGKVLIARGMCVQISECLPTIENYLSQGIVEVRFVCGDVLHVDSSLEGEKWQGVNVILLAKQIRVWDKQIIDLSGISCLKSHGDPGQANDGSGMDGKDGYPGSSGGNALITAEEVIGQNNLKFISNGGAGGDGQKGGDGRDGLPGKAMEETEMRNGFDSYVRTSCKPGDLIWKQVTSDSRRGDYKQFSSVKPLPPVPHNIKSLIKTGLEICNDIIETIEDKLGANGTGYISGTRREDGLGLEFNYDHWAAPFLNKSNFFICYGTNGKSGQPAGEGGLGGDGGFAGNLDTQLKNIALSINPGDNGHDGDNGDDGRPGTNGWDIGYHDHNYWKTADYVGTKRNRKLKVVATGKKRQDGLSWCKYLDNYVKLNSAALPTQSLKVCKVNVNKMKRLRKQNHATATRSKAISREEMDRRYNHELQAADRLMADITAAQKMAAEMVERAMQSMALNKLQEDDLDIAVEEKVSRQAHYVSETRSNSRPIACATVPMMQSMKIIDLNIATPENLRIAELAAQDIVIAYENIQNWQWNNEEQKFGKELLVNRYRVLQLQEIDLKINSFVKDLKDLLVVNESDFLSLSKDEYFAENISKFLFFDSVTLRKEAVDMLRETVTNNKLEDLNGLWPLIKCVLMECNKSQYKNLLEKSRQWKHFQDTQSQKIAMSFQHFQGQLFLNVDSHCAWKKWKSKEISKKTLYDVFDTNETLSLAFETYENHVQKEFDFSSCIMSLSIMEEVYSYIQNTNLLAENAYFYLLQYLFDVTLQIYSQNNILNIDASGLGKSTIIFKKGLPCIPLRVNREFMGLVNSKVIKSTVTRAILVKFFSATTIEEFSMLKTTLDIRKLLKEKNLQVISCRCKAEDIDIIMYIMQTSAFVAEIYHMLKLISTSHFDRFPILHTIAQRLSCEPILLSNEEFLFVLNKIVATACDQTEGEAEMYWILSVFPIEQWLARITLLNLENYFRSHIDETVLSYLSETNCKEAVILFNNYLSIRSYNEGIDQNVVKEIFRLLSNMQDGDIDVQNLALNSWPFALKSNYWKSKLRSIETFESDNAKVNIVNALENKYGSLLVEELITLLGEKFASKSEASYVLDAFHTEKWALRSWVLEILGAFTFVECIGILNKTDRGTDKDKTFAELFEIISDNSNSSKLIKSLLIEIKKIYEATKNTRETSYVYALKVHELLGEVKKCDLSESNYTDQIRALAIIDRGIELFKGFRLRDTQKLAILVLLSTKSNALLQVSTGEGKSLIVVAAAILKTLRSENVDIITSSTVLAKRDAETMKPLFGYFKITVSHNCQVKVEDRREVYSKNRVIYGDVSGFQRDFLLDRFYDKNILGDRTFDNVLVDEVDSMLLDKGNNMLYLSHEICGLDKLQSIYVFIWKLINASGNDLTYLFDSSALKNAVLHDLFGLVQLEDLKNLCDKLTENDVQKLWMELQSAKIIDCDGKLIINKPFELKDEMIIDSMRHLTPRIQFLLNEMLNREQQIVVPKCFYQFIEQHLDSWIESAKNAFFLIEKQDYVVDVDRSGAHLGQNIVILDRNTGTDMTNSQWDEALHQFLQIKHGCKLTAQSLKAVFISNVTYLQKYKHLCGLTGTLGSQPERELLKEIHAVEFLTIPHNKNRKFKELCPMLCEEKGVWIKKILEESNNIMLEKRSVLIICDTVQDVNSIYKEMGGKKAANVRTYTREYEDVDLTTGKRSLEPMQILISTNLAGRGTDILLSSSLRDNGGLHVCLTYLTGNSRIEEQALGRAARAGDQGSGRIICMKDMDIDQDASEQHIYTMKMKRDSEELRRLSDIKTFYEKQIKIEEGCFDIFAKFYSAIKNDPFLKATQEITGIGADIIDKAKEYLGSIGEFCEDQLLPDNKKVETVRETIRSLVLKTHLDNWAFWLDKNTCRIEQLKTLVDEEKFYADLQQFLGKLTQQNWKTCVTVNPWITMKLGKFLIETDNNTMAAQLLSRVVRDEPNFSAFAHYYNAKALTMGNNCWNDQSKRNDFEKSLRQCETLLSMHNERLDREAGIISNVRKEITSGIITVNAFEEQQSSQKLVHDVFLRNIGEYFGLQITPDAFHSDTIDKKNAAKLFQLLIDENFINKVRVIKLIPEKELVDICDRFGIVTSEELRKILWKFQKMNFHEEDLIEELKSLNLSSRERFWKEMTDNQVITKVVDVVIFNCANLKEYNSELYEKVEYLSIKGQLQDFVTPLLPTADSNNFNIQLHKFSNVVTASDSCSGYRMFLRDDLVSLLGATVVAELEKSDFASFNMFGNFNVEKAKALTSWKRALDLRYFDRFCIQKSEQDCILRYLVDCKVLDYVTGNYHLTNATNVSSLKPFPIYDSVIRSLLTQNFTLRNTLTNLITKVEKSIDLQSISLHSNPEKRLFFALVDAKIIQLSNVSDKDFDKKQLETIIWSVIPPIKSTQDEEDILEQAKGCLVKVINCINDEHEDVNVNFVFGVLSNYQHVLKRFEHPAANLHHIAKFLDTEKEFDFSILLQSELNDEHEVISWDEARWTKKIVAGALVVAVFGIVQIAIGVAIEFYTAGWGTQVGAAFISEGMNDIMYSIGALVSGRFTWADYKKQKLISLAFTALTFGIAGFLSKGAKFSRFGRELMMPGTEVMRNGVMHKATDLAGRQLVTRNTVGLFATTALKRIGSKAVEGVAYGLVSATVDKVIDSQLRSVCEFIARQTRQSVTKSIENHEVNTTLRQLHVAFGSKKANEKVDKVTKHYFAKNEVLQQLIIKCKRCFSTVLDGLKEAFNVTVENKALKMTAKICKFLKWANIATSVLKVTSVIIEFYDRVNAALKLELQNHKGRNFNGIQKESCEEFQLKRMDSWKERIDQYVGNILADNVFAPVMNELGKDGMKAAGRRIKSFYEQRKMKEHITKLDVMKTNYERDKRTLQILPEDEREVRRKELRKSFDESLLKLMKNTRDPKLFARIIREGGKIDAVGVRACIPVLENLLNAKVAIVVENPDKTAQHVHGDTETAEHSIVLTIENHHYTLNGGTDTSTGDGNDCLLSALDAQLQLAGVTHATFRALVAEKIETDKVISDLVSKGLHRYGISEDFVGGAKIDNREKLNQMENEYYDVERGTKYKFSYTKDVDNRNFMAKHLEVAIELSKELNIDPGDLDARKAKELLDRHYGSLMKDRLIRINNDNLADSFNVAFDKAMARLYKVCTVLKLGAEAQKDLKEKVRAVFQGTKYDQITMEDNCNKVPGLFPTEMDANVSVYSNSIEGEWRRYNFSLNLNLDNPSELDNGPSQPHIGYNFRPVKDYEFGCKVLEVNKPEKLKDYVSVGVSVMQNQFTDKKYEKKGTKIEIRAGHVIINSNKHLPDRGRSMSKQEVDANPDPEFKNYMLEPQTVFLTPVNDLHKINRFTANMSSQYEGYEIVQLDGSYVNKGKEDWKELRKK